MTDEQAVTSTVLDYYDGWFDGDAGRMERALHPQLAKRAPLANGKLDEDTASGMIQMTAEGRGKQRDPGDRGTDVDVVEIYGSIASVVVRSNIYREYLHLVRMPDGWKIVNALYDLERA
jgi:putative lumazine-binding protein